MVFLHFVLEPVGIRRLKNKSGHPIKANWSYSEGLWQKGLLCRGSLPSILGKVSLGACATISPARRSPKHVPTLSLDVADAAGGDFAHMKLSHGRTILTRHRILPSTRTPLSPQRIATAWNGCGRTSFLIFCPRMLGSDIVCCALGLGCLELAPARFPPAGAASRFRIAISVEGT